MPKYDYRRLLCTRVFAMVLAVMACSAASAAPPAMPDLFIQDDGVPFQVSSHSGSKGDAWTFAPGERKDIADIEGPGVIRDIWFTCSGLPNSNSTYLRDLIVRVYWDGETEPSVETPFGDFFGCGFNRRTTWESEYLGVTSGGFYCYFPMPFKKRARIEIENKTKDSHHLFFHILGHRYKRLPKKTLYFHAQWRRENPTTQGKNYTILEAQGEGYFAGVMLNMQPYEKTDKWNFLEGDEFMYVDGETDASIKGTGGEDYFQGGWYFIDGTFTAPYHGLILRDSEKIQLTAYRFHLLDRVNFTKKIRVEIEHGNRPNNNAKADFSSVAYWYQKEPHTPFTPLSEDRAPAVLADGFIIPHAIEWEGTPGTRPWYMSTYQRTWSNNMAGFFDRGATSRTFELDKAGDYTIGINLIGHNHGGTAKVFVDGSPVGSPIDTYRDDPMDFYLLSVNRSLGLQQLGTVPLSKGKHEIRIEATGKNEASEGTAIAVDCVTVAPAE